MLDLTSSIDTDLFKTSETASNRRSAPHDDSFARTLNDVTRPTTADTSTRQIDQRMTDSAASRQDGQKYDGQKYDAPRYEAPRQNSPRQEPPRQDAATQDNTRPRDDAAPQAAQQDARNTDTQAQDKSAPTDTPATNASDDADKAQATQEDAAAQAASALQTGQVSVAPTPAVMISLIAQAQQPGMVTDAEAATNDADTAAQAISALAAQPGAQGKAGLKANEQTARDASLEAMLAAQTGETGGEAAASPLSAALNKGGKDSATETKPQDKAEAREAARTTNAETAGKDVLNFEAATKAQSEAGANKEAPRAPAELKAAIAALDTAAAGTTPAATATQSEHGSFAAHLQHVRGEPLINTASGTTAAPGLREAVPMDKVGIEIATAAKDGVRQIEIRLDPGDMGRIDVRLDVDSDGNVNTWLIVDKPETLEQLKKDAPNLQRSLEEAGLKTDSGSLNFSLRDQNNNQKDAQDNAPSFTKAATDEDDALSPAPLANTMSVYRGWMRGTGGVDLKI